MKKYIFSSDRNDGFGAQYQDIVFKILYAEFNNLEFVYNDIKSICHNYNNDENHTNNLCDFMNIKNNYLSNKHVNKDDIFEINTSELFNNVESNIDIYTNNNKSITKIKECFWKNKDKNHFKNEKINIAVHIRRSNKFDTRIEGTNKPDNYYLNVINHIRNNYKNKEILFHIYSQGNIENFDCYKNEDVVLHIDEELTSTFTGLVAADILVTSASSFSYTAALLTDGEVYYLPFWHKPKKEWKII
jgi:hypothetical protein